MSIEVEIKAWVDDFNQLKEALDKKYKFDREYEKEDVYLKGIDSITEEEKEIRLRSVGDGFIVTFKERSHQDKVEVNIEKEFTVDNDKNFLYTMEKLGFVPYIRKNKKGYCYKSNHINIELSHVEKLGDFVEIEYITDSDTNVEDAKIAIYEILDNLNISRDKVEDKFYVEMLLEKKRI